MYKIAVCDDEQIFLNNLAKKLEKYQEYCQFDFYTDPLMLQKSINNYDAVFIDYQMPQMDAYTFFESIEDVKIEKVVITNHDNVVYSGFKYNFFWFLRKDSLDQELPEMMEKLLQRLYEQTSKLVIRSVNRDLSIPIDDINYVEVDKNYVIIHSSGIYRIRCAFSTILDTLSKYQFVMPIYGTLINVNFIKYINYSNYTLITLDNKRIDISRRQKKEVTDRYRQYRSQ